MRIPQELPTVRTQKIVNIRSVVEDMEDQHLKDWLLKVQTKNAALLSFIESLHRYFPVNVYCENQGERSPTLQVIESLSEIYPDLSLASHLTTELDVINAHAEQLRVYYYFLAYGRKSRDDKLPAKWDCTKESLLHWIKRGGINLAHISFMPDSLSPSAICNYELGMFVAYVVFPETLQRKHNETEAVTLKPVTKQKKAPLALRRRVEAARRMHSGVDCVIEAFSQHIGIELSMSKRNFHDEVLEQAVSQWESKVNIDGVYVAYRSFLDSILEGVSHLAVADIVGVTADNERVCWGPEQGSLGGWVEANNITQLGCKWNSNTTTAYERKISRIPLMRDLLQRQDLVHWGISVPGFHKAEESLRGLHV